MSVGVRCFQCKEKLKGRGTGQKHKEATGHSWQPGYYCTDCRQTFSSYGECRRHTRQPGVHSNAGPTRSYAVSTSSSSSLSASDRPPRLGGLVPVGVAPSTDDASSSSESEMESEDEKFPRCTACRPPIVFSSRGSLEQHLARTYTCTKCSIHLYTAESLQDHYRSSSAHPNCRECGNGLPGLAEWATHRARCPPPVPSAAESMRSTSAPRSISDRSSFAPASARDSDVASHDGTTFEPSEVSSLAPGSPPLNPTVVAMSHDTPVDSAMSNEISTSNAIDQTPLTENEVSDAGVLPDGIAPLKVDKGKGNARASDGIATPAAATAIPEGDAQRTATSSLSFHCRSCLADPCVEPVATLCGHVFCHSCIARELAAKMCCPVCQRPFLVRLHVGVGS